MDRCHMKSHNFFVRKTSVSADFRQSRRIFAYTTACDICAVALRAQVIITPWEMEPQHLGHNRDAPSRDMFCQNV